MSYTPQCFRNKGGGEINMSLHRDGQNASVCVSPHPHLKWDQSLLWISYVMPCFLRYSIWKSHSHMWKIINVFHRGCMDFKWNSPISRMALNFFRTINSNNRVQKRWRHKKLFLDFSVLDTMYRWSMMKNIHSPNWVGIGSWGPEIWLHEYLISPIEISVNWSGSKQLWTRPIYTDFNRAN